MESFSVLPEQLERRRCIVNKVQFRAYYGLAYAFVAICVLSLVGIGEGEIIYSCCRIYEPFAYFNASADKAR